MGNYEIEKKYIADVTDDFLKEYKHYTVTQNYLYLDEFTEIRVRERKDSNNNSEYFYTVKIITEDKNIRNEIEKEITLKEYLSLKEKTLNNTHSIIKERYIIPLNDHLIAEVDIYKEQLEGLKIVEIEFNSLEEANSYEVPEWFKKEVTEDIKYKNRNLCTSSYKEIISQEN